MFSKATDCALYSVHLVDNKSIHLKTRMEDLAVARYTHVHFPPFSFEENTVQSIVLRSGARL